jgi:hypothetical protein
MNKKIELLKRYADKAEITKEEFEQAKSTLSADDFEKLYLYQGTKKISYDEYNKARGSHPKNEFTKQYSEVYNSETGRFEHYFIAERYFKLTFFDENELQTHQMDELISEIKSLKASQKESEKKLSTIKGCVVFFTVLTVINLICAIASAIALASIR